MITYVYQLGLGKPNDETQKFEIERDLVFTEEKITQETVKEMSAHFKCDIRVVYLGELIKPDEAIEKVLFTADYHTNEMVEKIKEKWSKQDGSISV